MNRLLALRPHAHLVGDDASNQVVTLALRMPQDVEVPYVKEVVDPWRVADYLAHQLPRSAVEDHRDPMDPEF